MQYVLMNQCVLVCMYVFLKYKFAVKVDLFLNYIITLLLFAKKTHF